MAVAALALGLLGTAGPATAAPPPEPSRLVLTPTATPATAQSFSWRSPAAGGAGVQIRPADGGETRAGAARAAGTSKDGTTTYTHYSSTVGELRPGTTYVYRVGRGDTWSPWRGFRTATTGPDDFAFVYYGDAQVGFLSAWRETVRTATRTAPQSVGSVHAGDLVNTGGAQKEWTDWHAGMGDTATTTNVIAAPGNHEYAGDTFLTAWKANFEFPLNQPSRRTIGGLASRAEGTSGAARQTAAYFDHFAKVAAETVYYTDYQGFRFVTLNATTDSTFLRPADLPACSASCPVAADLWIDFQAAWLDHVLTGNDRKWTGVTFHQPVYSASEGRDEPRLRSRWVPVLQKHDVDLVMMGHDHVYARGFKDSDATSLRGVTTGPVYVVSNSGGKHYPLSDGRDNVWTRNVATQVRRGQQISTFQVVRVGRDRLTYTSYIGSRGPTATVTQKVGDVWDEVTITKDDAGRKLVTEAGVAVPDLDVLTPRPVITRQPVKNLTGTIGDDLRAEVAATGDDAVTYRWQRSRLNTSTWADMPGQDDAQLRLDDVTAATAGYKYRAVATSGIRPVVSSVVWVEVVKKESRIALWGLTFHDGRVGAVAVHPSHAGTVRLTVTHGSRTYLSYRRVTAGADQVVRMSTTLPGNASGSITARVDLAPDDSENYGWSSATKTSTVR
jgi:hypothetical protein